MTSPETWNLCVAVLTAVGYREISARALIGKQLSTWSEADVVAAYERASGKADPRAYAAKVLSRIKPKARKEQDLLDSVKDPGPPPASREVARAAIGRGMAILKGRQPGDDFEEDAFR